MNNLLLGLKSGDSVIRMRFFETVKDICITDEIIENYESALIIEICL